MMNIRTFALAALIATSLNACSGAGSLQVAVPGLQEYISSLQSSGGAKTSIETTKTNATVTATATDLTPYRSEFDATVKAWIVYYYSPSKNKSYVCKPQADKSVTVTEVTDTTKVYQAGDTIETTKVTVDASTATETAVKNVNSNNTTTTNTTNNNTNVTNNVTVQNVYLISPAEAKRKGRNSENPVYEVTVNNNQMIYIDASTGQTINAGAGAAVSTGTGTAVGGTVGVGASATPSMTPSMAPSAAPSMTPSMAPSADPSAMPSAAPSATASAAM